MKTHTRIKIALGLLLGAAALTAQAQVSGYTTVGEMAHQVADRYKWPVYIDPRVENLQMPQIELKHENVALDMFSILNGFIPDALHHKSKNAVQIWVDGQDQKIVIRSLSSSKHPRALLSQFEVVEPVDKGPTP